MNKNVKKLFLLLIILPVAFALAGCKKKNNPPTEPEPVSHEISYVLNGGINNPSNPTSYIEGNETITLLEPSKDNYDFMGWFADENFDQQVTEIEANSTENKTFYAKWKATEYSLTYILNGGTNSEKNPLTYTIEDKIVFEDPSFEPYIFEGWFLDEGYISRISRIEVGTSGNKNIYAKWRNVKFDITYILNGGTNNPLNPDFYWYSTNIVELSNPTREGYTFEGWFEDENFENHIIQIEPKAIGNKTIYAKWEAIDYEIVYELNGGDNNRLNPSSYNIEAGIISLNNPSKFGYDFSGWFLEENFETEVTEIDSKTQNRVVLYAKWTPKTYKIYFDYDGATENNTTEFIEASYNAEIGELPVPVKEGYVFKGWWRNNILITADTIFTFNSDITLTATWTLYEETLFYTISFDSDGGTSIDAITEIPFGSTITEPVSPTKNGYIFDGWYLNDIKWDFEVNKVISDETLTAKWSLRNYEIEYILNEGENNSANPASFTIEDEVIFADPTREFYDFKGWFIDEDLTEKIEKIEVGTTGKITVYAYWVKSPFTKATADIKVKFNLPKELASLYEDYEKTISVYQVEVLPDFSNTNLGKFFRGYSYTNYYNELVVINDNIYKPDSSNDVVFTANWDVEGLLKYYYTDGLVIQVANNSAYIFNYSGSAENVFIPEYYNIGGHDFVINRIGENSFENNMFISKITFLPRTQTLEISDSAFKDSSIAEFDFTYVTKICNFAFENSMIKSVEVSNNLVETESGIFQGCLSLTEVNLVNANEYYHFLNNRSFFGCEKLASVTLPETLISIGDYAFAGCKSLLNLDFLSQMNESSSVGNYAFSNCTSIDNIYIPYNIANIGENIFTGCTGLKKIEITRLFNSFYGASFSFVYGINSVEEITVSGDLITKITSEYFANLSNLTKFVMSDYVTIIEENAFRDCSLLSDVTLSKNLELENFTLSAFTGTYWISQMKDIVVIETTVVYIPANENVTEVTIESGVTAISQNASKNNEYLKSIFIPNTVDIISTSAFEGCTALETVQFETDSNLIEISNRAFANCNAIKEFSLENCTKLKTIGENAFFGMASSNDSELGGENGFVLPNSLEIIGDNVFGKAKITKVVSNGNHIRSDENGILYEINEQEEKTAIIYVPVNFRMNFYILPSTIIKIYDYAFYYTSSPNFAYINNSVQLGRNAFRYSTVLTGSNADISFKNSSSKIKYYNLNELSEGFEYNIIEENYSFTITDEEIKEGYYYIHVEEKVFLISVDNINSELLVTKNIDITDYFEYL